MHGIDLRDAAVTRRPSLWQQIASSVLTFDRGRLEPLAALRCAIGVALPLAIAIALGQAGAAVFIAVGAVSVGFGSFQGAYRSRAAVMLLASAGMAVSVFAGSQTGGAPLAAIAVAAAWSFAAGLLVAFGPPGAFVGLQSTVAVLIADAYPADFRGAAVRAVMVLIGGLVQTLFVVGVWPLRRYHHERRSIAAIYGGLAAYARSIAAGAGPLAPAAAESPGAAAVRRDPHPFARPGETLVFQALLDEADRLRASLAALSIGSAANAAPIADAAAQILDAIASAVEEARTPANPADAWDTLHAASAGANTGIARPLRRQLAAAWETAQTPAPAAPTEAAANDRASETALTLRTNRGRTPRTVRALRTLDDSLMTLRANLSPDSAVFRHALRLALAVTAATAISRLAEIPRGYWLPMTTLLVLKPEFRETFVTGSGRIVGTLIGGALASLLTSLVGAHHAVLGVMLLVFAWLGYTLFRASYTLFTICFTAYVVVLLTLSGVAGLLAAEYRIVNTIAGGLFALFVYRVWPTWESGRAPDALAALIEALAADARCLFGALIDAGSWNDERLRASRNRARLARSNAEASVERMLAEPDSRRRIESRVALGLLAAGRRYALGALALHAQLAERPSRSRPELAPLRDQILAALERAADELRRDPSEDAARPRVQVDPSSVDAAIDVEIDMMADAANTINALIDSRT